MSGIGEDMGNKEQEAIRFLKENKQLYKLLDAMKEKYIRMGKLTGKVSVSRCYTSNCRTSSCIVRY